VPTALLAAEHGSKFYSFAMRERSSWVAATLLGPRCVLFLMMIALCPSCGTWDTGHM